MINRFGAIPPSFLHSRCDARRAGATHPHFSMLTSTTGRAAFDPLRAVGHKLRRRIARRDGWPNRGVGAVLKVEAVNETGTAPAVGFVWGMELVTELALLRRWTDRRDAEAFNAIVVRYAPMVHATCRRILRNSSTPRISPRSVSRRSCGRAGGQTNTWGPGFTAWPRTELWTTSARSSGEKRGKANSPPNNLAKRTRSGTRSSRTSMRRLPSCRTTCGWRWWRIFCEESRTAPSRAPPGMLSYPWVSLRSKNCARSNSRIPWFRAEIAKRGLL